jgi:hypothetical protein
LLAYRDVRTHDRRLANAHPGDPRTTGQDPGTLPGTGRVDLGLALSAAVILLGSLSPLVLGRP